MYEKINLKRVFTNSTVDFYGCSVGILSVPCKMALYNRSGCPTQITIHFGNCCYFSTPQIQVNLLRNPVQIAILHQTYIESIPAPTGTNVQNLNLVYNIDALIKMMMTVFRIRIRIKINGSETLESERHLPVVNIHYAMHICIRYIFRRYTYIQIFIHIMYSLTVEWTLKIHFFVRFIKPLMVNKKRQFKNWEN